MASYDESVEDRLDNGEPDASDAELIAAVRIGDDAAFAVLWQRHEAAALRLARQVTSPSNAEDLVSESFARLLRVLQKGGGPDGAFRPYLFATMRRLNIDNARSYGQRVALTDDDTDLETEPASSAADVAAANAENSAAWRAWASLPEASRTLLWHLLVEEETPAQIAPLIGTSANGVSSRAVRARERLRQAFLQEHVADAANEQCRVTRSRLGEYVRDALSARDRAMVQAHLDECDSCPAVLFEITNVNQTMRAVIAPVVIGGVPLSAYLGGSMHAVAAVGTVKLIGAKLGSTAGKGILAGTGVVAIGAIIAGALVGFNPGHSPAADAMAPSAPTSSASVATAPASTTPAPIPVPATSAPAPSEVPSATPAPTPTPSPVPRPRRTPTPTPAKSSTPAPPVVSPTTPTPAPTPPATPTPTPTPTPRPSRSPVSGTRSSRTRSAVRSYST